MRNATSPEAVIGALPNRPPSKATASARIQADVDAWLAGGHAVEKVPAGLCGVRRAPKGRRVHLRFRSATQRAVSEMREREENQNRPTRLVLFAALRAACAFAGTTPATALKARQGARIRSAALARMALATVAGLAGEREIVRMFGVSPKSPWQWRHRGARLAKADPEFGRAVDLLADAYPDLNRLEALFNRWTEERAARGADRERLIRRWRARAGRMVAFDTGVDVDAHEGRIVRQNKHPLHRARRVLALALHRLGADAVEIGASTDTSPAEVRRRIRKAESQPVESALATEIANRVE